ncbi:SDR family oxidoreductase [Oleiagrimonas sp. C23AA]|uniref:SDR family oxidoreductase n=1 Tax=Oleiagrimonas sp. C23AA TaxID=2719047 RepID=UPI00142145B7|nr:SDR family oxidoreductase [Oleiagrimonas sp. C23AA]NII10555.1 SDR family oxidoreductase [Oleiagrimonas sp. C23AA]
MSDKEVALITGANKGIGLAVARQLGVLGYAVWLGCRDAQRGAAAAAALRKEGLDAQSLVLDVTNAGSVEAARASFQQEAGALDVLINNAGISIGSAMRASEEPVDDMRAMFEVNTFGAMRMTQAFLPLLRKVKGSRIVMVSSSLGSIAETSDPAGLFWDVGYPGYSASKSALNMLTVKLAKELMPEGIKVNAINPGYTATDLNGHNGYRSVEDAAKIVVELAKANPLAPTGGFFHDGHATQHRHAW